jgi:PAS domain S-box-containing protein
MTLSTPETRSIFELLRQGKIDDREAFNAFISAFQDTFARLEVSEKRYRELYDNAPDMYHTLDLQGNFVEFNPRHMEVLGFSKEELEGAHVTKICPESALPRFGAGYQKMMEQGFLNNYELDLQKKDGSTMTVEVHAMVYDMPEGQEVRCIMRDITERKQLDEQLRQSQKMESVGQLAGGVAHDFNNLLSAIMSYTELTMMKTPASEPTRAYLSEIQKAAERASHLTRQLLTFSRRQISEPKVLDLNELICDTEKMLRRLISEDIELVIAPSSCLWNIMADPGQMEQVIINLVVNARDAINNGGKITINTSNVTLDAPLSYTDTEVPSGDYIKLSVLDNGCGMRDEVKAHIFDPFFTTKEVGKGTGLGLSTCYGIVADSGGIITVESEPGQGTAFSIYLPRVEDQARELISSIEAEFMPGGHETLLLVEDEMSLRMVIAQVLREHGYNVLEASNGVDAINIVHSLNDGKIDLILTDVVMPLMGGREMVDHIRAAVPDAKVIYTSGYPGESIGHLDGEGANFIQKPITPTVLTQRVREMLDR